MAASQSSVFKSAPKPKSSYQKLCAAVSINALYSNHLIPASCVADQLDKAGIDKIPPFYIDGNKVCFKGSKPPSVPLSDFKELIKDHVNLEVGKNSYDQKYLDGYCYMNLYDCFGLTASLPPFPTLKDLMDDFLPKFYEMNYVQTDRIPPFVRKGENIHFRYANSTKSILTVEDLVDLCYEEFKTVVGGPVSLNMFFNYNEISAEYLLKLFVLYPNFWSCQYSAFAIPLKELVKVEPLSCNLRLSKVRQIIVFWQRFKNQFRLELSNYFKEHDTTLPVFIESVKNGSSLKSLSSAFENKDQFIKAMQESLEPDFMGEGCFKQTDNPNFIKLKKKTIGSVITRLCGESFDSAMINSDGEEIFSGSGNSANSPAAKEEGNAPKSHSDAIASDDENMETVKARSLEAKIVKPSLMDQPARRKKKVASRRRPVAREEIDSADETIDPKSNEVVLVSSDDNKSLPDPSDRSAGSIKSDVEIESIDSADETLTHYKAMVKDRLAGTVYASSETDKPTARRGKKPGVKPSKPIAPSVSSTSISSLDIENIASEDETIEMMNKLSLKRKNKDISKPTVNSSSSKSKQKKEKRKADDVFLLNKDKLVNDPINYMFEALSLTPDGLEVKKNMVAKYSAIYAQVTSKLAEKERKKKKKTAARKSRKFKTKKTKSEEGKKSSDVENKEENFEEQTAEEPEKGIENSEQKNETKNPQADNQEPDLEQEFEDSPERPIDDSDTPPQNEKPNSFGFNDGHGSEKLTPEPSSKPENQPEDNQTEENSGGEKSEDPEIEVEAENDNTEDVEHSDHDEQQTEQTEQEEEDDEEEEEDNTDDIHKPYDDDDDDNDDKSQGGARTFTAAEEEGPNANQEDTQNQAFTSDAASGTNDESKTTGGCDTDNDQCKHKGLKVISLKEYYLRHGTSEEGRNLSHESSKLRIVDKEEYEKRRQRELKMYVNYFKFLLFNCPYYTASDREKGLKEIFDSYNEALKRPIGDYIQSISVSCMDNIDKISLNLPANSTMMNDAWDILRAYWTLVPDYVYKMPVMLYDTPCMFLQSVEDFILEVLTQAITKQSKYEKDFVIKMIQIHDKYLNDSDYRFVLMSFLACHFLNKLTNNPLVYVNEEMIPDVKNLFGCTFVELFGPLEYYEDTYGEERYVSGPEHFNDEETDTVDGEAKTEEEGDSIYNEYEEAEIESEKIKEEKRLKEYFLNKLENCKVDFPSFYVDHGEQVMLSIIQKKPAGVSFREAFDNYELKQKEVNDEIQKKTESTEPDKPMLGMNLKEHLDKSVVKGKVFEVPDYPDFSSNTESCASKQDLFNTKRNRTSKASESGSWTQEKEQKAKDDETLKEVVRRKYQQKPINVQATNDVEDTKRKILSLLPSDLVRKIKMDVSKLKEFKHFPNDCYAESMQDVLAPLGIYCYDVFKTNEQEDIMEYYETLMQQLNFDYFGAWLGLRITCLECEKMYYKQLYVFLVNVDDLEEDCEERCPFCQTETKSKKKHKLLPKYFVMLFSGKNQMKFRNGELQELEPIKYDLGTIVGGVSYSGGPTDDGLSTRGHYSNSKPYNLCQLVCCPQELYPEEAEAMYSLGFEGLSKVDKDALKVFCSTIFEDNTYISESPQEEVDEDCGLTGLEDFSDDWESRLG